jgi:hypothetical protein
MSDTAIIQIYAALKALAMASTVAEVKDIRDKAEAIRLYVKQRDGSLEAQNLAAELKVRAERKLGELLKETVHRGGNRKSNSHDGSLNGCLPDGISHNQSHRWQKMADVPEPAFEQHLAVAKDEGELTTAGVMRLAAELDRQERRRDKAEDRERRVQAALADAGDVPTARVDHRDCLEWLADQPEKSIDLIFGSPPYADARLYLENGADLGIARGTEEWVRWMVEVYQAALRCCKGLVAFVVDGRTENYRYSEAPGLLKAALKHAGITLRKAPIFHRVGIPGSGGPDWLRNDYEEVVRATNGGPLPWSDNTAMGHTPKYAPGGDTSHRRRDGSRVNGAGGGGYAPPERANPGNLIRCEVGGGHLGSPLAHDNEAPFAESLAEFFVRSFCPPGGVVADPFCGSGTTLAVALRHGRRAGGCDVRPSQVSLTRRRLRAVQGEQAGAGP